MTQKKSHSRIAIVIGTKAELVKCFPVMLELQKRNLDYWFIHTGQHPLGAACKEFGVKKPDFVLSKEPKISTKFWSKINNSSIMWSFAMVLRIRKLIRKLNPRYVIYHGDTMSTATASIGSSRHLNPSSKWKNVHLEAGLRSGSIFEPFPEEISRKISSYFSHVLFAVSEGTEKNLSKKYKSNKSKKIINTGNTIVDSALIAHKKSKTKMENLPKRFVLVNLHRHENLVSKKRMEALVSILEHVKMEAIWPLHDNTEYYLNKYGLMSRIKKLKNIKITPLKNYFEFLKLISKCDYLVTDGGSIQEESLVFNKPCVILREKTERVEGLDTGINFLTKLNIRKTAEIIKDIESGMFKKIKSKNPYGKKNISKKIVDELLK